MVRRQLFRLSGLNKRQRFINRLELLIDDNRYVTTLFHNALSHNFLIKERTIPLRVDRCLVF